MPERTLTKKSSDEAIAAWISKCIATRIREGNDESEEQSAAICYSEAREDTGKSIRRK